MLSDFEFIRYQRQIALSEVGEQGQRNLLNSHVLLIG
ncbi:molybdopterin-synthase adenylyltransferase MoeB, partial [Vibrio cyclitrophicus]